MEYPIELPNANEDRPYPIEPSDEDREVAKIIKQTENEMANPHLVPEEERGDQAHFIEKLYQKHQEAGITQEVTGAPIDIIAEEPKKKPEEKKGAEKAPEDAPKFSTLEHVNSVIGGGVVGAYDSIGNTLEDITKSVADLVGADYKKGHFNFAEEWYPHTDSTTANFLRETVKFASIYASTGAVGRSFKMFREASIIGQALMNDIITEFIISNTDEQNLADYAKAQPTIGLELNKWMGLPDETSEDLSETMAMLLGTAVTPFTSVADENLLTRRAKDALFYTGFGGASALLVSKATNIMIKTGVAMKNNKKIHKLIMDERGAVGPTGPTKPGIPGEITTPPAVPIDTPPPIKPYMMRPDEALQKIKSQAGAGTRAANVNLHTMNTTEDVRILLAENLKAIEASRGARSTTVEQLLKEADKLDMSLDELERLRVLPREKAILNLAAKQTALGIHEDIVANLRLWDQGEIPSAEMALLLNKGLTIADKLSDLAYVDGLATKAWDIPVSGVSETTRALKRGAKTPKLSLDDQLALYRKVYETFGDKASLDKVLAEFSKASKKELRLLRESWVSRAFDYTLGVRVGSFLSSPRTHAKNIIGNIGQASLYTGDLYFRAGLQLMSRNPDVTFRSATANLMGQIKGYKDALVIMSKNAKEIATGNYDKVVPVFADNLDKMSNIKSKRVFADVPFSELGTAQKGLVVLDQLVSSRPMGNALVAEDNIFKLAAFQGKVSEMASLANKDLDTFTQNMTKSQRQEALDYARRLTFTNELTKRVRKVDPEGNVKWQTAPSVLGKAEELIKSSKIGMFFIPFVRVNLNVFEEGLSRVPILGLGVGQTALARQKGQWSKVAARQAFGVTAITTIGIGIRQLDPESKIYGTSSYDPDEALINRTRGIRPGSMSVLGWNINTADLGPAGFLVGVSADLAKIADSLEHVYGAGDDEATRAYEDVASSVGKVAMAYLTPEVVTDVVASIHEAGARGAVSNLKGRFLKLPSEIIPYTAAVRDYHNITNMSQAATLAEEGFAGSLQTILQHFYKTWAPGKLPKLRDQLGNIVPPTMVMAPIKKDPLLDEIARLGGMPEQISAPEMRQFYTDLVLRKVKPYHIIGGGIPSQRMNLVEYDELQQYVTGIHPNLPKNMLTLQGFLRKVVGHKKYVAATDKTRIKMIRDVYSGYASAGREAFRASGQNPSVYREMINTTIQQFKNPSSFQQYRRGEPSL